jgi:3-phosphoshikimate 1-carboxyvinyltransferase
MALPDLIEIVPLTAPVRAEITVPGSKSITNRALILAALADGETILKGALWSEDTQIMVECLQELGFMVNVEPDPNETCNRTITVYGHGGAVPPGGTEAQPLELFVGNAGTAARFLAPFLCLGSGVYRLHGVPRMHERPQAALFVALRELGYRVEAEKGNDKLPVKIWGAERGSVSRSNPENQNATASSESGLTGEAAAGHRPALQPKLSCKVSIEESSQFASALLLSAKQGGWEIEIVGENADESPYVAMTSKLIEAFPKGGEFQIEPDASSGSYFLAASVYSFGEMKFDKYYGEKIAYLEANVSVKNWPVANLQIDARFEVWMNNFAGESVHFGVYTPEYFQTQFGSNWRQATSDIENFGFERIKTSRLTDLGDSIMTAITVSSFAALPTEFADLGRLRVQECERVVALRTELTKCGAKVIEEGDTLTLWPSQLHGAEIETYNDHRMAMCFAILGLKVPGIKIKNPACVKKTFPNFFQKLAALPPHGLGAEIWEIKDGQRTRKLNGDDLFAD